MNLASKMRRRINGKHAHATTKAHPYVENPNIELPVGNTVQSECAASYRTRCYSLRRQIGERIRQSWRAAP